MEHLVELAVLPAVSAVPTDAEVLSPSRLRRPFVRATIPGVYRVEHCSGARTNMLDIAFVRQNPDIVRNAVREKREKADVEKILELDA